MNKKNIILVMLIVTSVTLISALILGYLSVKNYFEVKKGELAFQEKNLKSQIVDECLEKSTVRTPEKEEPVLYIYDICMKDKGAETVYSYSNP